MKHLVTALLALTACGSAPAQSEVSYATRPEVRAFVRDMVERHSFVERELMLLFSRAQRQEAILRSIQAQPERSRSWEEYRANFLTEARIRAGLEFWQTHRPALKRATSEFGVPEEVIVAILGVETFYGRRTGQWKVVDALTTLAFDYPPRSGFFRTELESFLLLARQADMDVLSVQGSYAGAIGIPQFMPRSYLNYAIDFDGDGSVDLRANPVDSIGSVANFLKRHGWRAGEPIQVRANVSNSEPGPFADGSVRPRYTLTELAQAGIGVRGVTPPGHDDAPAALVELITPRQPSEYRLGFHNFYVLTRYNRSILYASAVLDLANALRESQRD